MRLAAVQRISSNDASKLQVGQAQYSGLLTPQGTLRRRPARLPARRPNTSSCVVNAGNIAEGLRAGSPSRSSRPATRSRSTPAPRYALAGRAGPEALERPAAADRRRASRAIMYYWFAHGEVAERPRHDFAHRLHRRGWLRDLRAAPVRRPRLAGACSKPGKSVDIIPCGLGARDTLRLEAGMRLHGNDIDETTTAVEADLELDRRLEEGRFPRRRRAARAEGRRRRAEDRRLRDDASAASHATATTSTSATRRPASSPAARRRRS